MQMVELLQLHKLDLEASFLHYVYCELEESVLVGLVEHVRAI